MLQVSATCREPSHVSLNPKAPWPIQETNRFKNSLMVDPLLRWEMGSKAQNTSTSILLLNTPGRAVLSSERHLDLRVKSKIQDATPELYNSNTSNKQKLQNACIYIYICKPPPMPWTLVLLPFRVVNLEIQLLEMINCGSPKPHNLKYDLCYLHSGPFVA